jgi:hypothetical protein
LKEYTLNVPMSVPEATVDIVVVIVWQGSVQVKQVAAEHGSCQNNTAECLEVCHASRIEDFLQWPSCHWPTLLERFITCR